MDARRWLLVVCFAGGCIEQRATRVAPKDETAVAVLDGSVQLAERHRLDAVAALEDAERIYTEAFDERGRAANDATAEDAIAVRRLATAEAKQAYAARLLRLRRLQYDERDADLVRLRALRDFRYTAARIDANQFVDVDQDRMQRERAEIIDAARQRLLDDRRSEPTLSAEVAGAEVAWQEHQRDYDYASRGSTRF